MELAFEHALRLLWLMLNLSLDPVRNYGPSQATSYNDLLDSDLAQFLHHLHANFGNELFNHDENVYYSYNLTLIIILFFGYYLLHLLKPVAVLLPPPLRQPSRPVLLLPPTGSSSRRPPPLRQLSCVPPRDMYSLRGLEPDPFHSVPSDPRPLRSDQPV